MQLARRERLGDLGLEPITTASAAVSIASGLRSFFGGGSKGGPAAAKGASFSGTLGPSGLAGSITGYSQNQAQQFSWPVPLETAGAKSEVESRAPGIRKELTAAARKEGLPAQTIAAVLAQAVPLQVSVGPYVQIWPAILEAYQSTLAQRLMAELQRVPPATRAATAAAAAAPQVARQVLTTAQTAVPAALQALMQSPYFPYIVGGAGLLLLLSIIRR